MDFRGLLGGLMAFLFLLLFQTVLVTAARRQAAGQTSPREVRFMDLMITYEDENYSLSRLQFYLWTFFGAIGFSAVFLATYKAPDIPQNLWLLMGVNVTSTVVFTAITKWKPISNPLKDKPDFIKDLFFEDDASLDLPKTQMFIWTIISLFTFSVMVIRTFINGAPTLPDMPLGLVALMGVSHGAYLGTKAASKIS